MTLDERHVDLLERVEAYMLAQQQAEEQHDPLDPSVLVIAVYPRGPKPNTRTRIVGNVQHLAKSLAVLLAQQQAKEFIACLEYEMSLIDAHWDTRGTPDPDWLDQLPN